MTTPRKIGFGQVKQYEVDQNSDSHLIKRVAQGESDAATLLIERHQGPLRSFLIKLTRRPHLADDIAQDTFIRMLRYADRYDPKYALKTWLFTIARRLFINHTRRAEQRNVSSEYLGMASEGPTTEQLTTRADELNYKKQKIDAALDRLTETQRTCIVLFHQQEMSIQEVAKVMELPTGTVKSHLHRGRATMRKTLAPEFSETIE